ncbi:hypothetical protein [Archangium violaceum]|uniref:Lipoprotein n=1 Tax=Archangium violaceum Cb vi76 TaxID=1406225 RepID=A0A084SIB2_9BACT|nr:hypothetical protein [Archangium violaceum]KFA88197.1 hypothetical protein Q664_42495 [Archangium violaceum Cb vi76]
MRESIIRCGLVVACILAGCGGGVEETVAEERRPDEPDEPVTALHVPTTQTEPLLIKAIYRDTTVRTLLQLSLVESNIGRPPVYIPTSRPRREPNSLDIPFMNPLNALKLNGPLPGKQFSGLGRDFRSFDTEYADPAPSGDVGLEHYVQTVNDSLAVFDKKGTGLVAPMSARNLWLGTVCEAAALADGMVRYDQLAGSEPGRGRWIITHRGFLAAPVREEDEPRVALGALEPVSTAAMSSGPSALWTSADKHYQCVAVSETNDPTGRYHRYIFEFEAFNDAPKLGVWSNAYFLTVSMSRREGEVLLPRRARICAMEREKMVKGQAARMLCFDVASHAKHYADLLPADLDGEEPPPAGSPHYVFSLRQTKARSHELYNRIAVWTFEVDWGQPKHSSLTGPFEFRVEPFEQGFLVRQRNESTRLNPLGYKLTGRAPYRNFKSHQSILLTHSIPTRIEDGEARGSGLRWYELRLEPASSGQLPRVHQSGTYAPGGGFRWMGSIAFDKAGNIALGYSLSIPTATQANPTTLLPSLGYTGRTRDCPAGTMARGEMTLRRGEANQRTLAWATNSSLTVDPVDGCTFWFTAQYMPRSPSSVRDWSTHIGAFQLPGCLNPAPTCQ